MKPLDLHIYEKHPEADAYRVGGFYSPYCTVSRDKRFTDAELAAEYWRCAWAAEKGGAYRHEEQKEVLYRMTTLPHFDHEETP